MNCFSKFAPWIVTEGRIVTASSSTRIRGVVSSEGFMTTGSQETQMESQSSFTSQVDVKVSNLSCSLFNILYFLDHCM